MSSTHRRVALLALGALALHGAGSAASVSSPARYRGAVNAMCRRTTVQLHAVEAQLARARTAGDAHAYGVALDRYFNLGLHEDAVIETTPVPAALRSTTAPAIELLRQADRHVHAVLTAASQGNGLLLQSEVLKLQALAPRINKALDAAGLRDCGANQN
jgi:hypothetical protein